MDTSAIVRPRVDLLRGDSVNVFDKSYLASALSPYLAFSEEYQVPIYCGEFGADTVSFAQNRGGSLWVTDMLELMQTQAIGFNYHTYHEDSFGLYQNNPLSPPAKRNDALYSTFFAALAENALKGDVNADGICDLADVITLQRYLLHDGTTLDLWVNADLYRDGVIDVFDLAMLKRELMLQ